MTCAAAAPAISNNIQPVITCLIGYSSLVSGAVSREYSACTLAILSWLVNRLNPINARVCLAVYVRLRIMLFCEGTPDARGPKSPDLRRCPADPRPPHHPAPRCKPHYPAHAHHQPQYSAPVRRHGQVTESRLAIA